MTIYSTAHSAIKSAKILGRKFLKAIHLEIRVKIN